MGRSTRLSHDGTVQRALEGSMNLPDFRNLPQSQGGKVGYILLWALGVPIPILFLFYLLRGCS